ncbi:MAG: 30S ribosomal protein S20 [Candidatus Muiribacteriaceae bacterium]
MAEERKRKHTPEEKRIIQARKRQLRNKTLRSTMKTAIKNFEKAVENKAENSEELLKKSIRIVDKMVTKGIVHKNAASRKKSRLVKKLQNTVQA